MLCFQRRLPGEFWFVWLPSQLENKVNAMIFIFIYCYYASFDHQEIISFGDIKSDITVDQGTISFGNLPKNSSEIDQS